MNTVRKSSAQLMEEAKKAIAAAKVMEAVEAKEAKEAKAKAKAEVEAKEAKAAKAAKAKAEAKAKVIVNVETNISKDATDIEVAAWGYIKAAKRIIKSGNIDNNHCGIIAKPIKSEVWDIIKDQFIEIMTIKTPDAKAKDKVMLISRNYQGPVRVEIDEVHISRAIGKQHENEKRVGKALKKPHLTFVTKPTVTEQLAKETEIKRRADIREAARRLYNRMPEPDTV